jgi:two-component system chemotaxis response regulator CheB
MIVDDSQVARAVLGRMVEAHSDFELVAVAADAGEALERLAREPVDVVVLDLEMPGGSGLDALPEIVRRGRGAKVLIVSSFCDGPAEAAVKALGPDQVDILAKPGSGQARGRFPEELAERLRRMGRTSAPAHSPRRQPGASTQPAQGRSTACVAVGASTGGLAAVMALLAALPRRLGAPIVITQHLPAVFVPFFARQLEGASQRRAIVAEDGAELRCDEIVLAPGDAHLLVERAGGRVRVRLDRDTVVPSGCIPSVDLMLDSVAGAYGRGGLGVILSGMGRDGLAGARKLVGAGGRVLVQDRDSSAVWGMPGAVAEAGLATAILPPADIAARIALRGEDGAWR